MRDCGLAEDKARMKSRTPLLNGFPYIAAHVDQSAFDLHAFGGKSPLLLRGKCGIAPVYGEPAVLGYHSPPGDVVGAGRHPAANHPARRGAR